MYIIYNVHNFLILLSQNIKKIIKGEKYMKSIKKVICVIVCLTIFISGKQMAFASSYNFEVAHTVFNGLTSLGVEANLETIQNNIDSSATMQTGWVALFKTSSRTYWGYKQNGLFVRNQWVNVIGWYWITENYIMYDPVLSKSSWTVINDRWYEFDQNGKVLEKTSWAQLSGKWIYYIPTNFGLATNEFFQINGKTYYFTSLGYMYDPSKYGSNWHMINGRWYQFSTDGSLVTNSGWSQSAGKSIYYIPGKNALATNEWLQINNVWYYFDKSGYNVPGAKNVCGSYANTSTQKSLSIQSTTENAENGTNNNLNVTSETESNSIVLNWDNISNHYGVFIKDKLIWTGKETKFVLNDLKEDSPYSFTVVAYDDENNILSYDKVNLMTEKDENYEQESIVTNNKFQSLSIATTSTETSKEPESLKDFKLESKVSQTQVHWEWTGTIPDSDGLYEVYRDDKKIGETQMPCFNDNSPIIGKDATYKVVGKVRIVLQDQINYLESKGESKESDGYYYKYYEALSQTNIPEPEVFSVASIKSFNTQSITSDIYDINYRYEEELKYMTFIPFDRVPALSVPGSAITGGEFGGDNRSFNYDAQDGDYRTRTISRVIFEGIDRYNPDTGVLENVSSTSTLKPLEKDVSPSHWYWLGMEKVDTADSKDVKQTLVEKTPNYIIYYVTHSVGIPFGLAPAVDYWYVASFNKWGTGSVSGAHDQAPSHELYYTAVDTDIPIKTIIKHEHKGFSYLLPFRQKEFKWTFY